MVNDLERQVVRTLAGRSVAVVWLLVISAFFTCSQVSARPVLAVEVKNSAASVDPDSSDAYTMVALRANLSYGVERISWKRSKPTSIQDQRAFEAMGYVLGLFSGMRLATHVRHGSTSCADDDDALTIFRKLIAGIDKVPAARNLSRENGLPGLLSVIYPCIRFMDPPKEGRP